jgi:hypothetical protein
MKMKAIDRRTALFVSLATTMVLAEWCVTRLPTLGSAGVVSVAVVVDLLVVLPVAFVLLVLRPAGRPLFQAVPVVAGAAMVAGVLLAGRTETKLLLRVVGAIVEVGVLAALARRIAGGARELREGGSADFLERVSALTDPVLRAAGLEIAVLYYAFVGPRRRPESEGCFAYTETTGIGGLLLGLGMLILVEGLAVHFVIVGNHPRVAWVLAAVDVYSLVWLFAAYHAARLRPVRVTETTLLVRCSLLWTAAIPRRLVTEVTRVQETNGRRDGRVLRACFGAPPEILVKLAEPVVARGLLGLRRTVTAVLLHVDDPGALVRALRT